MKTIRYQNNFSFDSLLEQKVQNYKLSAHLEKSNQKEFLPLLSVAPKSHTLSLGSSEIKHTHVSHPVLHGQLSYFGTEKKLGVEREITNGYAPDQCDYVLVLTQISCFHCPKIPKP